MTTKMVSARATKHAAHKGDEIVIDFYGPQGGDLGLRVLCPEDAKKLANDLLASVAELVNPS